MQAQKYPRPPVRQCVECARLSGKEARKLRKLYGPKLQAEAKTFCWDESVCPRRRNYHQNKGKENSVRRADRRQKKKEKLDELTRISVPDPVAKNLYSAYLYIYRRAPKNARTHAIGGMVYKGDELEAHIEPFHCRDPSWTEAKVEMLLFRLRSAYSIRKFEGIQRFDPIDCPIRPCPLHPETLDDV